MDRRRSFLIIIIGVLLLASSCQQASDLAPSFACTLNTGQEVSLRDFRGKTLVLNFWATWCPPCRQEIPELNSFYSNHQDEIAFLSVEVQEPRQEVEAFIKENKILYPVIIDSEQKKPLSELYQISVIPTTFIIDPQGKIIKKITGATSAETLEKLVFNE